MVFIYHLHFAMIVNRVFCMPRAARLYPISPISSRLFIMANSRDSGFRVHRYSNHRDGRLSAKILDWRRRPGNRLREECARNATKLGPSAHFNKSEVGRRTVANQPVESGLGGHGKSAFGPHSERSSGHWLTQPEWPGCLRLVLLEDRQLISARWPNLPD